MGVVNLHHPSNAGGHRGQLVNLTAARLDRLELDLQCRDCGRQLAGLAALVCHYDKYCKRS